MKDEMTIQIERILPDILALRHELHAHPEESLKEYETAGRIRTALQGIPGLEVLPSLMETDVVAVLNTDRPGPCLALRADMDALPIDEQTGVSYQSTMAGMMHACGHDGHMAILAGVAMVLADMADALPGKVKFIFQPAEEEIGGANILCQRGVLDDPKVDAIMALHGWPTCSVGSIALRSGPAMAANNPVDITICGQGSHGAYPHRGTDPIVAAAGVITALQTAVSRTLNPLDAGVVTIGRIVAGGARNVIPDACRLEGTIRYLRQEVGEQLRETVRRIAERTAAAYGAEAEVSITEGYPPVTNDVALAAMVAEVGRNVLGEDCVFTNEPPSLGVEDFAFYGRQVPGVMWRLGLRPAGEESYPSLHNSHFDFNDDALRVGIRMTCELARRFLSERSNSASG